MNPTDLNPHDVLGLAADATLEVVRSAYLRLVREHPPERDAEKFREIHSAYTLLNDPMEQAKALLALSREPPDLTAIITNAVAKPLRIPKLPLLALGNEDA
jgi:hypothetical protein